MIQYKNTIEAIYLHIDEVQQLVANFGTQGKIHSIEIDLAMDKLRNVYDLMLSLRLENILDTDEPQDSGNVPLEISTQEPEKLSEIQPKESTINQTVKTQLVKEETDSPEIVKEKTRAEIDSRVRMPLNESITSEKPKLKTVYTEDQLTEKSKIDLSSQIKPKPVSSITNAMGLNEKFELIQNLFAGDKNKFEQTMNYLNAASDFNEAYEYLSGNFNWDMNDNYVQRILELIRRKLIVKKNER